jgi:hypothetical protein
MPSKAPWPELYGLVPDPPQFPGFKFWGESIEIEEIRTSAGAYVLVALDPNGQGVKRQALQRLLAPDRTRAHEREAHFAIDLYAAKFGERPPFDGFK